MAKCKRCKPNKKCPSHSAERYSRMAPHNERKTFQQVISDPNFKSKLMRALLKHDAKDFTNASKGTCVVVSMVDSYSRGLSWNVYCSDCGLVNVMNNSKVQKWMNDKSLDCVCHKFGYKRDKKTHKYIYKEELVND